LEATRQANTPTRSFAGIMQAATMNWRPRGEEDVVPPPVWCPENLTLHFNKHAGNRATAEERACWQDVLGKNPVTEQDYERAAHDAYNKSWLAYAGQWYNAPDVRHYFVDGRLIVAITDNREDYFITCYHDHRHSGGRHLKGENKKKPLRQLKQEYWDLLDQLLRQEKLKQFSCLHGPDWGDC
jgi:hypothetical protein